MCQHIFCTKNPFAFENRCKISDYFGEWEEAKKYFNSINKNVSVELAQIEASLPLDDNGICIFHTPNIEWKKANGYELKFQQLLLILEFLSQKKELIDIDLREVHLLGIYHETSENRNKRERINRQIGKEHFKKPKAIPFSSLAIYHTIRLEYAIFYDVCVFEHLKAGHIDLRNCIFQKQLIISFSEINQIVFNDSIFQEGVQMEDVVFSEYIEFENCIVHKTFEIIQVVFSESVIFTGTTFNTAEEFSIEFYCTFQGRVDFTNVKFNGVTTFKNCVFEQETIIHNSHFTKRLIFDDNEINNNFTISTTDGNKHIFEDSVDFKVVEFQLKGKIIFENVNFANILKEDQLNLIDLSYKNKVVIGKGCIKYRVQTKPIKIKVRQAHQNLITELTNSFSSYFLYSNGFNLGVEFINKQLHAVELFYFTDEDISLEELYNRLNACEAHFWTFSMDKDTLTANDGLINIIDSYVSKLSILSKIGFRQDYGLWDNTNTEEFLKAISYSGSSVSLNQINVFIDTLKLSSKNDVNIKELNIQKGNAQIADMIINNSDEK